MKEEIVEKMELRISSNISELKEVEDLYKG